MEPGFLVFQLLVLWFETVFAISINKTSTNSTRPNLSRISRLPFAPTSFNIFSVPKALYTPSSGTGPIKANATTTDDRTSICLLATPSPSDWLPTWAFEAAYKASDPCKFAYCRSSHVSRFPNESALAALRKTVTGIYTTSTVIPTTVTQNNQTSVSGITSWFPTRGVTTLSSISAWWGNSWNEPCCDVCHLEAGTIALRYWPSSPPASEATTVVESGYTFEYPSIYWAFNTIGAVDGCSTIGSSDHSDEIFAFDPAEVSSLSPVLQTISGSTGLVLQTYSIDWEKVHEGNCENVAGYVVDDPANLDPFKHDACHPRIAVPSGFSTKVDPKWSNCINDDLPYGYYDPPRALVPASALTPSLTALGSPPTDLPAPKQGAPASPTARPTAAPGDQSPASHGASSPNIPSQSSSKNHPASPIDLAQILHDPERPPKKTSPIPQHSTDPPNEPSPPQNPSSPQELPPPKNVSPPSNDPTLTLHDSLLPPSKQPPVKNSSPLSNKPGAGFDDPSSPSTFKNPESSPNLLSDDHSPRKRPPIEQEKNPSSDESIPFSNPPRVSPNSPSHNSQQAPHDPLPPTKVSAPDSVPKPDIPNPRIFTITLSALLVLPSETLTPEGPDNAHPSPISISIASDRAIYIDNTLLGILPTPSLPAAKAVHFTTAPVPEQMPTAGARVGPAIIAHDDPTLAAFPAASAATLTANGATITIHGHNLNINAAAGIAVDDTTLAKNSAAIKINGHNLNLSAAVEMIDGTESYVPVTVTVPVPTKAAILTLGGHPITALAGANSGVIILKPGTTISAGGSAATEIGGTIVSVNSAGAIVLDGTNTVFPSATTLQSILPSKAAVLTIGGRTMTAMANPDSGNIILGPGTTIAASGAATTIDGTVVSVDHSDAIVLDGTSTVVPSFIALPSTLAQKAAVLNLGGELFTAIANPGSGEIVLGPGTTISANGAPATIDGTVISVNSARAVVLDGTKTIALSAVALLPSKTAILTLDGKIITATENPGSNEIILGLGTTITAGGAPATINGTVISVNLAGAVNLDSTKTVVPSAILSPIIPPSKTAIFTLDGHIFTATTGAKTPGVIILDPGKTITANGAAATIDGTTVSANAAGELMIGGTSTVTPSAAATGADAISANLPAALWISRLLHGGLTADRSGAVTDDTVSATPSGSWSTDYVDAGASASLSSWEAEGTLDSSAEPISARPMIAESMSGKRKNAATRGMRVGISEGCVWVFWLGVFGLVYLGGS